MKILRNWKTTITGVAAILSGVKIYISTGNINEALTAIIAGVGLLFAKDHDVTGK
jgi:hypothetical protein